MITNIKRLPSSNKPFSVIDPDRQNLSVLNQIFGSKYHTQKQKDILTKWYENDLKIFLRNGRDVYSIHRIDSQIGGKIIGQNDVPYSYQFGESEYRVKIRQLQLQDEKDKTIGILYLMAPEEENVVTHCVKVKITQDRPNVAQIDDLTKAIKCNNLGLHDKVGRAFFIIMLDYLKTHNEQLKINTVELNDNSHFLCDEARSHRIRLELSRQLEGDDPYYMQFDFKPQRPSSTKRLKENRIIMSRMLTGHGYGLFDLCITHHFSGDILKYIISHPDQLMSKTLKYISRKDCANYYHVYETMFSNMGLKELNYPTYILDL
jgi:hypothetical protein